MAKKIIYFSIQNPGSGDYQKIHNKIQSIVIGLAQVDKGLYLTHSERSSVNIREIINEINIKGDFKTILVANWEHSIAWIGLDKAVSNWIKNS